MDDLRIGGGGVQLSIGLPVYNGERYLRETVESILSQSFREFELIISDNASTDGTGTIAETFARTDPRVRYFRSPVNIGAVGNFNLVFEKASAPLFKWACADDRVAPGFLEAAVLEMLGDPGVVLCYGGITLVDVDGNRLGSYEQGLDLRSSDVGTRFRRACTHVGLLNVLQGVIRSEALRLSAPQGTFPGSDEVLMAELALHGRFHEIEEPMLFRRMHPAAASAGTTLAERLAHLDPRSRAVFVPRNWHHSLAHLRAICRAPLSGAIKLKLAGGVIRRMIQLRDHLGRELIDGVRHFTSRRERPPRAS